jgi:hypothetical protein
MRELEGIEISEENAKMLIDKWIEDRRIKIYEEYRKDRLDLENDCEQTKCMYRVCCDFMKK